MPRTDSNKAGRDTTSIAVAGLTVVIRKPTPGQLAVLRRVVALLQSEDKAARSQGGQMFLTVADALVSDQAILNRLYMLMADDTVALEEYAKGVTEALREFFPAEQDEAVKTTRRPRSTARAEVRR